MMTALAMFKEVVGDNSHRALARHYEVSYSYMNDMMNGRRRFPAALLHRIPNGYTIWMQQAVEEAEHAWRRTDRARMRDDPAAGEVCGR